MESITIFLAQLWGPALLAMGVGIFVSKGYYTKIYRDIEKEPLALLLFGFVGVAAGIAHIQAHNVWSNLPEIIVSLLGWILLAKAFVFLIKPKLADEWGNRVGNAKMIPTATAVAVVIGGYLTWVGYFMM
ncbi:MAG: hypothetical protein WD605_01605 [Candidatus Paceibacterota bacterium]